MCLYSSVSCMGSANVSGGQRFMHQEMSGMAQNRLHFVGSEGFYGAKHGIARCILERFGGLEDYGVPSGDCVLEIVMRGKTE